MKRFAPIPKEKRRVIWLNKKEKYSNYPGKGIVYDIDVVRHAIKHLHGLDKLNPVKVGMATMISQNILYGVFEEPEGDWYYESVK